MFNRSNFVWDVYLILKQTHHNKLHLSIFILYLTLKILSNLEWKFICIYLQHARAHRIHQNHRNLNMFFCYWVFPATKRKHFSRINICNILAPYMLLDYYFITENFEPKNGNALKYIKFQYISEFCLFLMNFKFLRISSRKCTKLKSRSNKHCTHLSLQQN